MSIRIPKAAWLAACITFASLAVHASANETQMAPLILDRTISLPNVSGRIDHMAVDLKRGRLFVAELGNNTVDVVDMATGKAVHRINGLHEPQGVGYAPNADVLAVANAGDGSVHFFAGENLSPIAKVELGGDADNIRLDPRSGRFLVGYGSGGIASLDPNSGKIVAQAVLPAHPEGFRVDSDGSRALVNVPDGEQIAVVDLTHGKQTAMWRMHGMSANFPMAWDETNRTIAVVFRNPARLALLDSDTGLLKATQSTCGDADDVFFDERRKRIYVSCGSGSVDVFQGEGPGYRLLDQVTTKSGARTSLFVPELDRLFVAERAGILGSGARVLVFRLAP
jgi:DNA-binding beta-propeller fold protein YncE